VFDLDCVNLYFEFFVFLNYQVAYCRFFYNLHILKNQLKVQIALNVVKLSSPN
jgi:hypothetical protein